MASESATVLILGANGQVGRALTRAWTSRGAVIALDRSQADLADLPGLQAMLERARPSLILNAAAYTAVDKAESEPELAHRVNALAPGVLADYAATHGALLVHYSTDYVFDGSGESPRDEQAPTGPLSVYGATKLEGEQRIAASGCTHLSLRTSWVYAASGHNFLRTMLRLAAERETLAVIDDQVGAPTHADWLAAITTHMVPALQGNPALSGLYHAVPAGETTWCRYARRVIDTARAHGLPLRVPPDGVRAINTSDYATAARRPLNSRLCTAKLQRVFGLTPPEWEEAVDETVMTLLQDAQRPPTMASSPT